MPLQHALHWYRDAMRLWKRGPASFCAIALVVIVANIALTLVPIILLYQGWSYWVFRKRLTAKNMVEY